MATNPIGASHAPPKTTPQTPQLPGQFIPHTRASPLDVSTANLILVANEPDEEKRFLDNHANVNHLEFPVLGQVTDVTSFASIVGQYATPQDIPPAVAGLFCEIYNLIGAVRQGCYENQRQSALAKHQKEYTENVELSLNEKVEEITNLELQKDTLMAAIAAGGANHSIRRSPEHPDPDHFSGKNPEKLNAWIQDMELKMMRNSDWFESEQHRMSYWVTRTKDDARGILQHGIGGGGIITFSDVGEIISILKASYGEVDEQKNASSLVLSTEQKKNSLVTFLPAWQALAAKSGFNDLALIAMLRKAVHPTLIARLNVAPASTIPKTLTGFISHLRTIDSQIRETDPRYYKKGTPNSSTNNFNHTTIATPDTTDVGDPMDLSSAVVWTGSNGGKRRPKTPAEKLAKKEYCIANNLCLWCESSRHRISDCREAPFNKDKLKNKIKNKPKEKVNSAGVADSESENE